MCCDERVWRTDANPRSVAASAVTPGTRHKTSICPERTYSGPISREPGRTSYGGPTQQVLAFDVTILPAPAAEPAAAQPEPTRPLFVVPGFFGSELRVGDCVTGEIVWGERRSIFNAEALTVGGPTPSAITDGPVEPPAIQAIWRADGALDTPRTEVTDAGRSLDAARDALQPCAPLQTVPVLRGFYEIDTYAALAANLSAAGCCVRGFTSVDRSRSRPERRRRRRSAAEAASGGCDGRVQHVLSAQPPQRETRVARLGATLQITEMSGQIFRVCDRLACFDDQKGGAAPH